MMTSLEILDISPNPFMKYYSSEDLTHHIIYSFKEGKIRKLDGMKVVKSLKKQPPLRELIITEEGKEAMKQEAEERAEKNKEIEQKKQMGLEINDDDIYLENDSSDEEEEDEAEKSEDNEELISLVKTIEEQQNSASTSSESLMDPTENEENSNVSPQLLATQQMNSPTATDTHAQQKEAEQSERKTENEKKTTSVVEASSSSKEASRKGDKEETSKASAKNKTDTTKKSQSTSSSSSSFSATSKSPAPSQALPSQERKQKRKDILIDYFRIASIVQQMADTMAQIEKTKRDYSKPSRRRKKEHQMQLERAAATAAAPSLQNDQKNEKTGKSTSSTSTSTSTSTSASASASASSSSSSSSQSSETSADEPIVSPFKTLFSTLITQIASLFGYLFPICPMQSIKSPTRAMEASSASSSSLTSSTSSSSSSSSSSFSSSSSTTSNPQSSSQSSDLPHKNAPFSGLMYSPAFSLPLILINIPECEDFVLQLLYPSLPLQLVKELILCGKEQSCSTLLGDDDADVIIPSSNFDLSSLVFLLSTILQAAVTMIACYTLSSHLATADKTLFSSSDVTSVFSSLLSPAMCLSSALMALFTLCLLCTIQTRYFGAACAFILSNNNLFHCVSPQVFQTVFEAFAAHLAALHSSSLLRPASFGPSLLSHSGCATTTFSLPFLHSTLLSLATAFDDSKTKTALQLTQSGRFLDGADLIPSFSSQSQSDKEHTNKADGSLSLRIRRFDSNDKETDEMEGENDEDMTLPIYANWNPTEEDANDHEISTKPLFFSQNASSFSSISSINSSYSTQKKLLQPPFANELVLALLYRLGKKFFSSLPLASTTSSALRFDSATAFRQLPVSSKSPMLPPTSPTTSMSASSSSSSSSSSSASVSSSSSSSYSSISESSTPFLPYLDPTSVTRAISLFDQNQSLINLISSLLFSVSSSRSSSSASSSSSSSSSQPSSNVSLNFPLKQFSLKRPFIRLLFSLLCNSSEFEAETEVFHNPNENSLSSQPSSRPSDLSVPHHIQHVMFLTILLNPPLALISPLLPVLLPHSLRALFLVADALSLYLYKNRTAHGTKSFVLQSTLLTHTSPSHFLSDYFAQQDQFTRFTSTSSTSLSHTPHAMSLDAPSLQEEAPTSLSVKQTTGKPSSSASSSALNESETAPENPNNKSKEHNDRSSSNSTEDSGSSSSSSSSSTSSLSASNNENQNSAESEEEAPTVLSSESDNAQQSAPNSSEANEANETGQEENRLPTDASISSSSSASDPTGSSDSSHSSNSSDKPQTPEPDKQNIQEQKERSSALSALHQKNASDVLRQSSKLNSTGDPDYHFPPAALTSEENLVAMLFLSHLMQQPSFLHTVVLMNQTDEFDISDKELIPFASLSSSMTHSSAATSSATSSASCSSSTHNKTIQPGILFPTSLILHHLSEMLENCCSISHVSVLQLIELFPLHAPYDLTHCDCILLLPITSVMLAITSSLFSVPSIASCFLDSSLELRLLSLLEATQTDRQSKKIINKAFSGVSSTANTETSYSEKDCILHALTTPIITNSYSIICELLNALMKYQRDKSNGLTTKNSESFSTHSDNYNAISEQSNGLETEGVQQSPSASVPKLPSSKHSSSSASNSSAPVQQPPVPHFSPSSSSSSSSIQTALSTSPLLNGYAVISPPPPSPPSPPPSTTDSSSRVQPNPFSLSHTAHRSSLFSSVFLNDRLVRAVLPIVCLHFAAFQNETPSRTASCAMISSFQAQLHATPELDSSFYFDSSPSSQLIPLSPSSTSQSIPKSPLKEKGAASCSTSSLSLSASLPLFLLPSFVYRADGIVVLCIHLLTRIASVDFSLLPQSPSRKLYSHDSRSDDSALSLIHKVLVAKSSAHTFSPSQPISSETTSGQSDKHNNQELPFSSLIAPGNSKRSASSSSLAPLNDIISSLKDAVPLVLSAMEINARRRGERENSNDSTVDYKDDDCASNISTTRTHQSNNTSLTPYNKSHSVEASSLIPVIQKLFNLPLSSSPITFTSSCPFYPAGPLPLRQNVSIWSASFDFLTSLEKSILSSSTLGMSQHTDVVAQLAVNEAANGGSSQFCFEETCVGLEMMNVLSAFAYVPPSSALSLRLLRRVAYILEGDPEKPLFPSFSSSELLPSRVYSSSFGSNSSLPIIVRYSQQKREERSIRNFNWRQRWIGNFSYEQVATKGSLVLPSSAIQKQQALKASESMLLLSSFGILGPTYKAMPRQETPVTTILDMMSDPRVKGMQNAASGGMRQSSHMRSLSFSRISSPSLATSERLNRFSPAEYGQQARSNAPIRYEMPSSLLSPTPIFSHPSLSFLSLNGVSLIVRFLAFYTNLYHKQLQHLLLSEEIVSEEEEELRHLSKDSALEDYQNGTTIALETRRKNWKESNRIWEADEKRRKEELDAPIVFFSDDVFQDVEGLLEKKNSLKFTHPGINKDALQIQLCFSFAKAKRFNDYDRFYAITPPSSERSALNAQNESESASSSSSSSRFDISTTLSLYSQTPRNVFEECGIPSSDAVTPFLLSFWEAWREMAVAAEFKRRISFAQRKKLELRREVALDECLKVRKSLQEDENSAEDAEKLSRKEKKEAAARRKEKEEKKKQLDAEIKRLEKEDKKTSHSLLLQESFDVFDDFETESSCFYEFRFEPSSQTIPAIKRTKLSATSLTTPQKMDKTDTDKRLPLSSSAARSTDSISAANMPSGSIHRQFNSQPYLAPRSKTPAPSPPSSYRYSALLNNSPSFPLPNSPNQPPIKKPTALQPLASPVSRSATSSLSSQSQRRPINSSTPPLAQHKFIPRPSTAFPSTANSGQKSGEMGSAFSGISTGFIKPNQAKRAMQNGGRNEWNSQRQTQKQSSILNSRSGFSSKCSFFSSPFVLSRSNSSTKGASVASSASRTHTMSFDIRMPYEQSSSTPQHSFVFNPHPRPPTSLQISTLSSPSFASFISRSDSTVSFMPSPSPVPLSPAFPDDYFSEAPTPSLAVSPISFSSSSSSSSSSSICSLQAFSQSSCDSLPETDPLRSPNTYRRLSSAHSSKSSLCPDIDLRHNLSFEPSIGIQSELALRTLLSLLWYAPNSMKHKLRQTLRTPQFFLILLNTVSAHWFGLSATNLKQQLGASYNQNQNSSSSDGMSGGNEKLFKSHQLYSNELSFGTTLSSSVGCGIGCRVLTILSVLLPLTSVELREREEKEISDEQVLFIKRPNKTDVSAALSEKRSKQKAEASKERESKKEEKKSKSEENKGNKENKEKMTSTKDEKKKEKETIGKEKEEKKEKKESKEKNEDADGLDAPFEIVEDPENEQFDDLDESFTPINWLSEFNKTKESRFQQLNFGKLEAPSSKSSTNVERKKSSLMKLSENNSNSEEQLAISSLTSNEQNELNQKSNQDKAKVLICPPSVLLRNELFLLHIAHVLLTPLIESLSVLFSYHKLSASIESRPSSLSNEKESTQNDTSESMKNGLKNDGQFHPFYSVEASKLISFSYRYANSDTKARMKSVTSSLNAHSALPFISQLESQTLPQRTFFTKRADFVWSPYFDPSSFASRAISSSSSLSGSASSSSSVCSSLKGPFSFVLNKNTLAAQLSLLCEGALESIVEGVVLLLKAMMNVITTLPILTFEDPNSLSSMFDESVTLHNDMVNKQNESSSSSQSKSQLSHHRRFARVVHSLPFDEEDIDHQDSNASSAKYKGKSKEAKASPKNEEQHEFKALTAFSNMYSAKSSSTTSSTEQTSQHQPDSESSTQMEQASSPVPASDPDSDSDSETIATESAPETADLSEANSQHAPKSNILPLFHFLASASSFSSASIMSSASAFRESVCLHLIPLSTIHLLVRLLFHGHLRLANQEWASSATPEFDFEKEENRGDCKLANSASYQTQSAIAVRSERDKFKNDERKAFVTQIQYIKQTLGEWMITVPELRYSVLLYIERTKFLFPVSIHPSFLDGITIPAAEDHLIQYLRHAHPSSQPPPQRSGFFGSKSSARANASSSSSSSSSNFEESDADHSASSAVFINKEDHNSVASKHFRYTDPFYAFREPPIGLNKLAKSHILSTAFGSIYSSTGNNSGMLIVTTRGIFFFSLSNLEESKIRDKGISMILQSSKAEVLSKEDLSPQKIGSKEFVLKKMKRPKDAEENDGYDKDNASGILLDMSLSDEGIDGMGNYGGIFGGGGAVNQFERSIENESILQIEMNNAEDLVRSQSDSCFEKPAASMLPLVPSLSPVLKLVLLERAYSCSGKQNANGLEGPSSISSLISESLYLDGEKMALQHFFPYEKIRSVVFDESLSHVGFEISTPNNDFVHFGSKRVSAMATLYDSLLQLSSQMVPCCPFAILRENSIATECRLATAPAHVRNSEELSAKFLLRPCSLADRILMWCFCDKKDEGGEYDQRIVAVSRANLFEFFPQEENWGCGSSSNFVDLNSMTSLNSFVDFELWYRRRKMIEKSSSQSSSKAIYPKLLSSSLSASSSSSSSLSPDNVPSVLCYHVSAIGVADDELSVALRYLRRNDNKLKVIRVVYRFRSVEDSMRFVSTLRYCIEEGVKEKDEMFAKSIHNSEK
ncbi:uncharacterized protein MONOS_12274 [Monocercomonoides exilis]|uniref:uncharacterized protein n=1 Tax=Monocercomonoides exilis TaxID=2049356 RepID=UPI00355A75DD|nr:hypothetical protein MONOS_12274 [Monocercomonoides exilis]|eukprot:MONOS_12274.1-p1 / transcript=MONOS_12274.1 / gene=MONOS_12274 / organism=Monocercomonoides_exilis_PA203 / gene_product=unspecified product / transcript_product=unspecified product / location=Mono_scaffold00669:4224-18883(-) / protein_length=4541 / sequence_SO=supercontig / SO=protein_coding / is_pseudo=false